MSATFEEERGLMLVAIPRDVIGFIKVKTIHHLIGSQVGRQILMQRSATPVRALVF